MGKKTRRRRPVKGSRREVIEARREVARDPRTPTMLPPATMEVVAPKIEQIARANHLRTIFELLTRDTSKKWDPRRIEALFEYHDLINCHSEDRHLFVSKEDFKFVKAILKAPWELCCIRALAMASKAHLRRNNVAFADYCHLAGRAIAICDETSERERQHRLESSLCSIGNVVDRIKRTCHAQLQKLRATRMTRKKLLSGKTLKLPIIGGDQCDVCGKTFKELGVAKLPCCGLCGLTFYCSRGCQKRDWKKHRLLCRKKGEFMVGDLAAYADPNGALQYGDFIWIVAPAPRDESHQAWLVCKAEGTKITVVEAKNLRRLRPALRFFLGSEHVLYLCKAFQAAAMLRRGESLDEGPNWSNAGWKRLVEALETKGLAKDTTTEAWQAMFSSSDCIEGRNVVNEVVQDLLPDPNVLEAFQSITMEIEGEDIYDILGGQHLTPPPADSTGNSLECLFYCS